MSLQSQYVIGLHRDKNPTKNRCRHNVGCSLDRLFLHLEQAKMSILEDRYQKSAMAHFKIKEARKGNGMRETWGMLYFFISLFLSLCFISLFLSLFSLFIYIYTYIYTYKKNICTPIYSYIYTPAHEHPTCILTGLPSVPCYIQASPRICMAKNWTQPDVKVTRIVLMTYLLIYLFILYLQWTYS